MPLSGKKKGTAKEPGSTTVVSTTASIQDRMIIELVIPMTPAQVEECQKYLFWEHVML